MVQGRTAKRTTPVLMAIDVSGSMHGVADDVRGGFNQYVADLVNDSINTYKMSLILFNTIVEKVHDAVEPTDVVTLTEDNYQPRGGTALYDAIGALITSYKADEGERPLVVVHTDGYENSSVEWRATPLKALVEARTREGWGFVFLGAGIDAWQGGSLGMSSGRTAHTREGTRGTYSGMSVGTVAYAAGASADSVTETAGQWSHNAAAQEADGGE